MLEEINNQKGLGAYVRENVLPTGISVKDAAGRLGVGRPALSNFLNGRATLSPDMATRLERSFGADRDRLLSAQDRIAQADSQTVLAARRYAPHFLIIKAARIEQWADSIDARDELPVLLRRLIRTTGDRLLQVEFHGYDNAQRHGWDGWLEAETATAWIPKGNSGWEFSTDANPRAKAERDFNARLKLPAAQRVACTFVFVTPRNWPGKDVWAKEKDARKEWKAVRAFDASDLEQWLEDSVPTQMWIAERLQIETTGWSTLDERWRRWTSAARPPLHPALFEPSVASHRETFKRWISATPDRVLVVAADSTGEAIAFLACLCADSEFASRTQDLAVVFDSPQSLRSLAASTAPLLAIAANAEVEQEFATLYRRFHCVAVRPRNDAAAEPDIALTPLTHDAFKAALVAMGIEGDEAERMEQESGRSPSILRRRRAISPALKTPPWATDAELVRLLIPMALIGAWQATQPADADVLAELAGKPTSQVEDDVARLRQIDDPPVWSIGRYHGVASKMDALFALKGHLTRSHLDTFFRVAAKVLREADPALELPDDQRWAAAAYGKARAHSSALRRGICETLVILSTHGDALVGDRIAGLDNRVTILIRSLLEPLTLERLIPHSSDLPLYAEAAPDAFIELLNEDLQKPEPVVLGILKSSKGMLDPDSRRTGLLWALEALAWRPERMTRVARILARLSLTALDDNLSNKPIASLQAVFRGWMPQTAAALEQRIAALKLIVREHPVVGWQLCRAQFAPGSRTGFYSYKPRWRDDAVGAGHVVTRGEHASFVRASVEIALGLAHHDVATLGDLVASLGGLSPEHQHDVWNLIIRWSQSADTTDEAKSTLRDRIRRHSFTRRGARTVSAESAERARAVSDQLAPADQAYRHLWLFLTPWVEESADEIEDDDLDYTKRQDRIHALRQDAIAEVWSTRGLDGILILLAKGDAPFIVGFTLAGLEADQATRLLVIETCLSSHPLPRHKADACVQGYLGRLADTDRDQFLRYALRDVSPEHHARLLCCAPFTTATWRLVDEQPEGIRRDYWRDAAPDLRRRDDAELTDLIDRLLAANRPRAAFNAAHLDWDKVETSRLYALLRAIAMSSAEPVGTNTLSAHDISRALTSLLGRPGVSEEQMAQLEFIHLDALRHAEHGVPSLERQVAKSPALYSQFIGLAFKRSGSGEDPPGWRTADDREAALGTAAREVLAQVSTLPGADADGRLNADDLYRWVADVRTICATHARADIGDYVLGELLARGLFDPDGTRPNLAVSEVLERIASKRMAEGYYIETHNSRGGHWRGEGGAQEREIAARFRIWANRRAFEFPFVAALLDELARSYEREAETQDTDTALDRRLRGW